MAENKEMHFSRIRVLADEPAQLMEILKADNYRMHQMLWRLFPDAPDATRDFLYRSEMQHGWPVFYVLSARCPVQITDIFEVETKKFSPKLKTGERLAFRLRANSVRTRKTDDPNPKKRKRDDVVMHHKRKLKTEGIPREEMPSQAELVQEAGEEWIKRQAARNGFEVEAVSADGYQKHVLYCKGKKIRFSSMDFDGILSIIDKGRFLNALYRGIGPAKAFGCGLMLIRRVA